MDLGYNTVFLFVSAVKHMASSLAVEWAQNGIRVNAISPGYMMTSLTAKVLEANQELKVSHRGTP
jgi:NAD(P)-dependent dehydrogenase (short-subunit alcohol dehydrogenase family)